MSNQLIDTSTIPRDSEAYERAIRHNARIMRHHEMRQLLSNLGINPNLYIPEDDLVIRTSLETPHLFVLVKNGREYAKNTPEAGDIASIRLLGFYDVAYYDIEYDMDWIRELIKDVPCAENGMPHGITIPAFYRFQLPIIAIEMVNQSWRVPMTITGVTTSFNHDKIPWNIDIDIPRADLVRETANLVAQIGLTPFNKREMTDTSYNRLGIRRKRNVNDPEDPEED